MEHKSIPQFPAYEVSECGTSIRRVSNKKEVKQGNQILNGKTTGYLYCTLLWDIDNNYLFPPKRVAVHRLVAFAWINQPETNRHVWINHKDGNKANNHRDNLEWTTISQNIQHAFDTGLKVTPKGSDHWRYGKKLSVEAKHKMSQAKLGANHPKFKGYYFANFKRFESANQAGKFLNMPSKTVISRCKSEKWRLKGWYFLPVDTAITLSNNS